MDASCDDRTDLILGVYRSFAEAGVNIWDFGLDNVIKNGATDIHDLKYSKLCKSKDKVYIYAADYLDSSNGIKSLSETCPNGRINYDCQSSLSDPVDEIMDGLSNTSDHLAFSDTRLNLSNNSSISENTSSNNEVIITKKYDFDESHNDAGNSNSTDFYYTEESNNASNSNQTKRLSTIKIMLVENKKKRNSSTAQKLEQQVVDRPRPNELKREKVEKKQKISKCPEDHLKLKKIRHSFTKECDICGLSPAFIPKCKFHNYEKFLFYRRNHLALEGNLEVITKIDEILPRSYHLISCDTLNKPNNDANIVTSLTTQWHVDSEETEIEKKKHANLRPVYRFFKDFSIS